MKKTLGILSALAISGSAFADVNVSGYLDAGYSWSNKAAGGHNAFSFNEGGVWFTGKAGGSSFVADLDVGNAAFEQAYVSHKYDNGFSWSLGVWDTQLGAEANDSVNRQFLKTGLLWSLLPETETGLSMGYDLSEALGLQLWVVNDTTSNSIKYPVLGFKLSSKMDGMNARVGAQFFTKVDEVTSSSGVSYAANGETGYLIDVGADSKFGDIHVAANLLLKKDADKNAKSGLGFGVEGGAKLAEGTSFDVGVEWVNDKAGKLNKAETDPVSVIELRAGPRFEMSDALTIKADYTFKKNGGDNAKNDKAEHEVGLAGIYKF